jgi:DNA polymerase-3 subunit beta
MHITIDRKTLLDLATKTKAVADKKASLPALGCTLLSAGDGRIRGAGTDLYLAISAEAECDVKEGGDVAVNSVDLYERVRAMPDGQVTLSATRDRVTIKSGSRRFELHAFPAADMPPMPKPRAEGRDSFAIPAQTLATLLARTLPSISQDTTRAHVNSLLLETDGKVIRAVSTDGHRLSIATEPLTEAKPGTTLIPRAAVEAVARMLPKDGNVIVHRDAHWVFFDLGGETRFATKTVDAAFPPYLQVVPKSVGRDVTVSRLGLLGAVEAVSVAASRMTNGVKLRLEKDTLYVAAESPEAGSGGDELPIDYDGPGLTIGFNAKYIEDALGAVDTDDVTLGLTAELDPCVVKPAGGDGFLACVMPMRV